MVDMNLALADAVAATAPVPPPPHEPMRRGALGAWWAQGLCTALFMRPQWQGLQVHPANLALLTLVGFGATVGMERLFIEGDAKFFWPSLMSAASVLLVWAWACWVAVPQATGAAEPFAPTRAPNAAALLSMMQAQTLFTTLVVMLVMLPMTHGGVDVQQAFGEWGVQFFTVVPTVWTLLAQLVLFWRGATVNWRGKVAGCMAFLLVVALSFVADGYFRHWYPDYSQSRDEEGDKAERFTLTQELIELQPTLLAQRLDALQPQHRRSIDVYSITFAPYAEADVFRRESAMVTGVMQQRFGAEGHVIQLMNHRDAAREWPWATPLNLQRTIRRVAKLMDREQDVLFIHLTSHGARSGELAASFWPLEVEAVTPDKLKAWLDEAGIRHRVLSISACYSGSWIAPLSDPDTLVMTAADAEHTSYGCGRRSEFTFFGRAMYDEQLRQTRSFEAAHTQARTVIEQREKEAGKDDGFSNPQIAMGERMREHLARLEAQLESGSRGQ